MVLKRPANHTKPKWKPPVRHVWIHEQLHVYQGLLIGQQMVGGDSWSYVAYIDKEQSQPQLVCRWVKTRMLTFTPTHPGSLPY